MFKSICVLGLGYIGLPTASTFATHGLHMVGDAGRWAGAEFRFFHLGDGKHGEI